MMRVAARSWAIFSGDSLVHMRCLQQAPHLSGLERTELARLQVAESEISDSNAPQLADRVADARKHSPDLILAALAQHHFVPRMARLFAPLRRQRADPRGKRLAAIKRYSVAKRLQLFCRGRAGYLHPVGLWDAARSRQDVVGKLAVVGNQQQTFAGVIEPPDRIDSRRNLLEIFHDRRPALRVGESRYGAARLVQHEIEQVAR